MILAGPVAEKITGLGGTVITGARVTRLIVANNRVKSVEVNGVSNYECDYVVMVVSLGPAHQIIRASSLEESFSKLLSLPTMPEVNLQLEFTRSVWPVDRAMFGVGTSLITFTEQSRTTFKDKPGRLSIILTPPDRLSLMKDVEIFEIFKQDAPRLGIDPARVTSYRVIRHPADFYLLSPHMNNLRPGTRTDIGNLFLAGDYVRQSFMATMEGAIITGNSAAREIKRAARSKLNG